MTALQDKFVFLGDDEDSDDDDGDDDYSYDDDDDDDHEYDDDSDDDGHDDDSDDSDDDSDDSDDSDEDSIIFLFLHAIVSIDLYDPVLLDCQAIYQRRLGNVAIFNTLNIYSRSLTTSL